MRHGQRDVIFVVECPRNKGDRSSRDDFLDEDDAAAPTIGRLTPDIKPQINLFKIPVKRNRNPPDASVAEQEPDQADMGSGRSKNPVRFRREPKTRPTRD